MQVTWQPGVSLLYVIKVVWGKKKEDKLRIFRLTS